MTFDTSEKLTKKTQNNKTVKIQEIVTKKQKSTKFRKKVKKIEVSTSFIENKKHRISRKS